MPVLAGARDVRPRDSAVGRIVRAVVDRGLEAIQLERRGHCPLAVTEHRGAENLRHRARSVNHLRGNVAHGRFRAAVQNLIDAVQRDVHVGVLQVELKRRVRLHCGGIEGLAALEESALQRRVHDVVADG